MHLPSRKPSKSKFAIVSQSLFQDIKIGRKREGVLTTYRIRAEAESFLELKRGCAETLLENREERFNGGSLLQQLRQTRKEMLCLSNSYLSGLVKDFCSQLVRFS